MSSTYPPSDTSNSCIKTEKSNPDNQPCSYALSNLSFVSSYTHAVFFDKKPILIGERINPTGKKRLKQALKENDIDYLLSEEVEKTISLKDVF